MQAAELTKLLEGHRALLQQVANIFRHPPEVRLEKIYSENGFGESLVISGLELVYHPDIEIKVPRSFRMSKDQTPGVRAYKTIKGGWILSRVDGSTIEELNRFEDSENAITEMVKLLMINIGMQELENAQICQQLVEDRPEI